LSRLQGLELNEVFFVSKMQKIWYNHEDWYIKWQFFI